MGLIGDLWRIIKESREENKKEQLSEEMQTLLALIRFDRDWSKGKHRWTHPTGVRIWIANTDYGLDVSLYPNGLYPNSLEADRVEMKLSPKDKEIIWQTICQVQEGIKEKETTEAMVAVALKIQEKYGQRN